MWILLYKANVLFSSATWKQLLHLLFTIKVDVVNEVFFISVVGVESGNSFRDMIYS